MAPQINPQTNNSFQTGTSTRERSKKASPTTVDYNREGQMRRLSQNQNSINMYLE